MTWTEDYGSPIHNANSFEELNELYRAEEERNEIRRKHIDKNYSIETGCYIKQKWYSWNVTADKEMLANNPCDGSKSRYFWMRCFRKTSYGQYEIDCDQYVNDPSVP